MKYLIVIVGPTAIGKTALSIRLAKHFHCEILSCDSRQFFREMSIGTAAPTNLELAAAPHHFVHNRSIEDHYTVGDFEKEATAKLHELFTDHDWAILVGGSGLYVDAVLNGLDYFPEIDPIVRKHVLQEYTKSGLDYLQDQLKQLDPSFYDKITVDNPQTLLNPQRMMRFIEVCIGSGKPYSTFLNQKTTKRPFVPIIIGLEAERQVLYDRINRRVDVMVTSGLLEEVKSLHDNRHRNALQTVGYREIFEYLDGSITLDQAIEEIKKNTRRFAKRQLTWFKKNEDIKWFDYQTNEEMIIDYITSRIHAKQTS